MAPRRMQNSKPSIKKEDSPAGNVSQQPGWTFPPPGLSAPAHASPLGPSPWNFPGDVAAAPTAGSAASGGVNMAVLPYPFVASSGLPSHSSQYSSVPSASPYPLSFQSTSQFPLPPQAGPSQLPLLPPASHSDSEESEDLPTVDELLKQAAKPAQKIAGARQSAKSKGKAKATDENPQATQGTKRKALPTNPTQPDEKRGRKSGAANYHHVDIELLLKLSRKILPLGGSGWERIGKEFNEEAARKNRPQRTARSLELKLKQLSKTTKPTGSAVVPDHVAQAYEIDDLIREKAGTRDLDDDEILDGRGSLSGSDDDSHNPRPSKSQYGGRSSRSQPPLQPRNTSRNILNNISLALDPSDRQARQQELSLQFSQNQQLFQLNNQLRDAHRRNDSLAAQLIESERRHQAAERRADRAEQRSQMLSYINSSRSRNCSSCVQQHISHRHHSPIPPPINPTPPTRPTSPPVYRQDIISSDGIITHWLDGSSDDYTGVNDSPGTIRLTYPDPRSYFEPSDPSSSTSAHHSVNRQSSTSPTDEEKDEDKDADDCSQEL